MREIKFRGMNLCGNWVYGDLRHDRMCMPDGRLQEYISVCGEAVHPKSVGQFTGLKDSAGKEIYEGDILFVKAENPYWSKFDSKHVVTWCNDGWILNDYGTDDPGLFHILMNNNCEIIGNVHDNPELLEVEA